MERASNPRASGLRMSALASAVALAVVLPLAAATADPAPPGSTPTARQRGVADAERRAGARAARPAAGSEPGAAAYSRAGEDGGLLSRFGLSEPFGDSRTTVQCGPALSSPEGVEAQTCVLKAGGESWARTYYRNATGEELQAVLVLMRPGGRTVRVHCAVDAADEPGVCETSRAPSGERTSGDEPFPGAVAEVASADGERSLLRSGSSGTGSPKA